MNNFENGVWNEEKVVSLQQNQIPFQQWENNMGDVETSNSLFHKVRITAIRQTVYEDLMTQYENPIDHA